VGIVSIIENVFFCLDKLALIEHALITEFVQPVVNCSRAEHRIELFT
jgi:hypothetical protein